VNFDYTYIILGKAIIFEPVTILTNLFITVFCFFAFFKVRKHRSKHAFQWSMFFLLIGLSSSVGSLAHGAHFQLGETFLRSTVFMMNAISLIAIFYCFKSAHTFYVNDKTAQKKYADYFVIIWIVILLIVTFIQNNFLLIKIHAGIVLTYSMIVHFIESKKGRPGGSLVAYGIIVSFFSIVIHSLKLSISEWFNYKDISHVIMLVSLIIMYCGVTKILNNRATPARI
jgi:hypothetical protein